MGGGSTTTTTPGYIPEEFKPYITNDLMPFLSSAVQNTQFTPQDLYQQGLKISSASMVPAYSTQTQQTAQATNPTSRNQMLQQYLNSAQPVKIQDYTSKQIY